jgi:hypothetical protein
MFCTLLPKNESTADRGIRIIVGIALLTLVFVGPHTAWGYVGLLPLLTGLIGSCPLYRVLGLATDHAHKA